MVGEGIRIIWTGLPVDTYGCNTCDRNCSDKFVLFGVCPIGVVR